MPSPPRARRRRTAPPDPSTPPRTARFPGQGLTSMRRSGPTRSERRPASSSSSSSPTSSRRQPCSVRTVGLVDAVARGGDDPLQVGAGGEQLVGELGLRRPGAHERLGQRDQRGVARVGRRRAHAVGRDRVAAARRARPRRRSPCRAGAASPSLSPRIWASRSRSPGGAWRSRRGRRRPGRSAPAGRPRARSPRATRRARARRRAGRGRASSRAAGGRRSTSGSRSSETSSSARHSSRAHSSRPRPSSWRWSASASCEQVQDVLARVADLLLAERARVPAREARALAQAHAE